MKLFNGEPGDFTFCHQHRIFVLTYAALVLLGIHFSGYYNVRWILIFIPVLFIFEGLTGISITRHFRPLFFYIKEKKKLPTRKNFLSQKGSVILTNMRKTNRL